MSHTLESELRLCIDEIDEIEGLKAEREEAKRNAQLNASYLGLLNAFIGMLNKVDAACTQCGFSLSAESAEAIAGTLQKQQENLARGYVTEEQIRRIRESAKEIGTDLDKDWSAFYKESTSSWIGLLNLVQRIVSPTESGKLLAVMTSLKNYQKWSSCPDQFSAFASSLKKAAQTTQEFSMDEEIRSFLEKVSRGSATVADLTPGVTQWLQEHQVERRIRLTF